MAALLITSVGILFIRSEYAVYLSLLFAATWTSLILGIKKIILVGSCGCLDEKIEDYSIILPTSAIRDEGTSYHYAPASEEVRLNTNVIKKIENKLKELNLHYHKGKTWTTDAIYRETPAKVQRRKEQGAITVDMECSAMHAVAKFRGKDLFQFFYAADNLDGVLFCILSIFDNQFFIMFGKLVSKSYSCFM